MFLFRTWLTGNVRHCLSSQHSHFRIFADSTAWLVINLTRSCQLLILLLLTGIELGGRLQVVLPPGHNAKRKKPDFGCQNLDSIRSIGFQQRQMASIQNCFFVGSCCLHASTLSSTGRWQCLKPAWQCVMERHHGATTLVSTKLVLNHRRLHTHAERLRNQSSDKAVFGLSTSKAAVLRIAYLEKHCIFVLPNVSSILPAATASSFSLWQKSPSLAVRLMASYYNSPHLVSPPPCVGSDLPPLCMVQKVRHNTGVRHTRYP